MALVIGLTGGIATGKSTVIRFLQELGVMTLDADQLVRRLEQPGTAVYRQIVDLFGPAVVGPDGQLQRRALAERVFADPQARRRLEAVVHPAVYEGLRAQIRQTQCPIVVVDIPLLYESGAKQWLTLDRVVVVDAPEPVQIERLMARDGLTKAEAYARLQAQWPMAEKVRQADDRVDNGDGLDLTRRQVERLVANWRRLAADRKGNKSCGLR